MAIQEDPSAELSAATVSDVTATAQPGYIDGGRPRDAGRGWEWIVEGYRYFRRSIGLWILLTVIFFAIVVAVQIVPFVGWIASTLLVPVLVGGLMAGCQAIERGGELELAHLFAGFRMNTAQLMLIGLIGFVLTAVIMIPAMTLIGAGSFFAAKSGAAVGVPVFGLSTLLGLLIIVALVIPVNMALWFAPALVMLQNQSATVAIKQSFQGCLRNIVPFLIYGVVLLILATIAAIPFGLGWLVLAPVLLGSVYAAYRDIFFNT
jgi:uncharacterized membrane protein